ncbi:MAG: hypothetical protein ACOCVF_01040 [bacterium]
MKKIIMEKGCGKTHQLILKSASTGHYIVCFDSNEASRIQSKAMDMGVQIPFPLTFSEFLNKEYYARNIKGFLIDNVEMLIQELTSVPIRAITLTTNETI